MTKTSCFLFVLGLTACFCTSCNKEVDPNEPKPLDYALQSIPSIDEVIPADLITAMGPFLNFGDDPPRIDTCFCALDSIRIARFIHNTDIDINSEYFLIDSQFITYPKHNFRFHSQHRGVADLYQYERSFGDIAYGLGYFMFENATVKDKIYIMGSDNKFTAYFKQSCKRRMEPDESLSSFITDYKIVRDESVIITGELTPAGVINFRLGTYIESYDQNSPRIGKIGGVPQLHDIIIYDYPEITMPYDTAFYKSHPN